MSERSYGQVWPIGEDGKQLERTPMTNDAERVGDIKTAINLEFQSLYDEGMRSGKHGHYETMFGAMHQAYAPYIEAQSKALAEARAIAVRMREITQDVWDKREGYTDRQAWSDLHGQAMQLLGWEVKSRSVTPTPENPNG